MGHTLLVVSLIFLVPGATFADEEKPGQEQQSTLNGTINTVRNATSELLVHAMGLLGVAYKYGGNSPQTGFDCSGFVSHVFREAAGVTLPHNAYQMSLIGQKVPSKDLQPGDLVFYNTLRRAFSHVGIYLGNNKFIHSASRGGAVQVEDMQEKYWLKRYEGARRVDRLSGPVAAVQPVESVPPEIRGTDLSTKLY